MKALLGLLAATCIAITPFALFSYHAVTTLARLLQLPSAPD